MKDLSFLPLCFKGKPAYCCLALVLPTGQEGNNRSGFRAGTDFGSKYKKNVMRQVIFRVWALMEETFFSANHHLI